ncbi:MAG: hypothetical protein JXB40_05945 [Candidatus Omnitrophica bacterium]|nr:hypothetical protein [Candidatus Omnitrophota bacterium]
MKKISVLLLLIVFFLVFSSCLFAADEVSLKSPKKKLADMTQAEISHDMAKILDSYEEVINFIPGLTKETDSSGEIFYKYKGQKIDVIDRKTLEKVYNRIRQERTRIRIDRINRQLESIRNAQRISATTSAGGIARTFPTVPNVPRIMPAPPSQKASQAPRVPAPPAPSASPER